MNNPVVEVGTIIEVGILNEKAEKYKTRHGLQQFVQRTIRDIADNLSGLGFHNIVQNHHNDDEAVEINNFRYCNTNRRKRSKTHRVFRSFGTEFYVECGDDVPDDELFGLYIYEMKDIQIEISISMVNRNHNQAPKEKIRPQGKICNECLNQNMLYNILKGETNEKRKRSINTQSSH